jgi:hypothetical protein
MTDEPLYRELAKKLQAKRNCIETGNDEWRDKHSIDIARLKQELPSGSGIDNGTEILEDECTPNRIVLAFGYHHMNESGMYVKWTHHKCYVTPSWDGCDIRITGPNYNDIKEYLYETFDYALQRNVSKLISESEEFK